MTSLRYFYLSHNALSSIVPQNLWNLKDLLHLNLSTNSLTGSLDPKIGNFKVVIVVDLSMNKFSGSIPNTIGGLQNLVNLSLAHNRFQGPIPESIDNILGLELLDLSHNNLSGGIPKSMERLSYLRYLDISCNRLNGEIPNGGPFQNFTYESFLSNEALCGASHFRVPPCPTEHFHKPKAKKMLLFILVPSTSVSLLVILALAIFLSRQQAKLKFASQAGSLPALRKERISYNELQRATNGFDESNLLCAGSCGSVYKGTLLDGTFFAVKVFNLRLESAFKSFDTECQVLRNLRHRNLTKVLTCCSNLDFKALVLEYMPNGSLEKWLYSHNYFLNILQRLDIMIDVACALDYLHHGNSTPIVHCDLKPSNILLDAEMVAHVSDFGIAKILGEGLSIAQTSTLATCGYIAPEYGLEGLVSAKCDVYSYGIVLMETFTRKKPTDEMFDAELSLKRWVSDLFADQIAQIIDANLLKPDDQNFEGVVQCACSILKLALSCCLESPGERMNIKMVLASLKKIRLQFLETFSDNQ